MEPLPNMAAPVKAPASKITLVVQFAAGFLGWFLAAALFYGQVMDQEALMICGGALFPVNLLLLFLLLKFIRFAGWGMLAALGVNLIVSLIQGLTNNAFCFIPFFANP